MDNNSIRASALDGIRHFSVVSRNKPQIVESYEVLLKIEAVGICGSDIHYYNEGQIGSQVIKYPFVIGHESAATVIEVGKDVSRVKPGDRVAIEPTLWCGECEQCLTNRKHTCLNQLFLGCPGQMEGMLKEFAVLPEICCFPVESDMPFDLAVFAEPLSIGIYALNLSGLVNENSKIAILGAGPIGQSVLASCVKKGFKNIFVTDKLVYRLEIAKKVGAQWIEDARQSDLFMKMCSLAGGGFDVVFECCGQQDAVDLAFDILKPGGKLMMIGIPENERISVSMDKMRRKEICFQNVRRQNESFQEAIDMIQNDNEYFNRFITHHFSLDNVNEGFDLVLNYRDNVMKAIVNIH